VDGSPALAFGAGLDFTTRDNSFADDTPFYSRRIGRQPSGQTPGGVPVVRAPQATSIVGAARLSGRTRGGWTIGLFSALTAREDATVAGASGEYRTPVEPAALATGLRVSRELREGESAIGLIVTSENRFGVDQHLADQFRRDAWTFGVDGRHRFGAQQYELTGWWLGSRIDGTPAAIAAIASDPRHGFGRPDWKGNALVPNATHLAGDAGQMRLARVSGSWRWGLAGETLSPGFEMNDLGFQRNADWRIVKADWRHETAAGSGAVRRWTFGSTNLGAGWNAAGESRAREADAFVRADFRSYWDATLSWTRDLPALGTEWLRGGPALLLPTRDTVHLVVDTDQRRAAFSATIDVAGSVEPDSGSWSGSLSPTFTARASDRIEWSLGPSFTNETVGWQYAGAGAGTWLVSRRRQQTAAMTARADLVFTVHAILQAYVQPFVSVGRNDRYQRLVSPRAADPRGRFAPVTVDEAGGLVPGFTPPDAVRRALNATVVFRWEYRPGSFVTAVWNRRLDDSENVRTTLAHAIDTFGGAGAADAFLVKTSLRLGR
jgi:hypothetical protein